jgi:hypothetical protein
MRTLVSSSGVLSRLDHRANVCCCNMVRRGGHVWKDVGLAVSHSQLLEHERISSQIASTSRSGVHGPRMDSAITIAEITILLR